MISILKALVLFLMSIVFSLPSAAHEDDHDDHHADESESTGQKKGITEYDTEKGFKLSDKALKTFDLKLVQLPAGPRWKIPATSVVASGDDLGVFRLREGFFKRVSFQKMNQPSQNPASQREREVVLESRELRAGDSVVISNTGFLRVVELAASGGVATGHSH